MNTGNNLRADAVFEGGSVKSIGLVGAIAVAKDRGYQSPLPISYGGANGQPNL